MRRWSVGEKGKGGRRRREEEETNGWRRQRRKRASATVRRWDGGGPKVVSGFSSWRWTVLAPAVPDFLRGAGRLSFFPFYFFFLPFSSFFLIPFISFLDYLFPLLLFVVLFSWYIFFWRNSSQVVVVVVVVVVSQGVSSHRSAVHSEH